MNRTRTVIAALALLLVAAPGCASSDTESAGSSSDAVTFPAAALATVQSDDGALTLEVRTAPDQPPQRGQISVEYRILDAGGKPVDGLAVDAVTWMPAMGHGAATLPEVHAEGEGRYQLDKVDFYMPGEWQLRTKITGTVAGQATPSFQIP